MKKKEKTMKNAAKNAVKKSVNKSNIKVLLLNGHGGIIDGVYQTPGKRSPKWDDGRQLFEGEFNREIVKRIIKLLNEKNIEYVNIVPEDEHISLQTRVSRVNKEYVNDKKCIMLSIHANAGGGTGFEVFTSPGETKSDKQATIYYNEFKKEFPELRGRKDMCDGDPDKEANYYVLVHTYCPAVLVECAFMDTLNPDCEMLMNDSDRDRFAEALVNAIIKINKINA